jgi:AsmA-like protein
MDQATVFTKTAKGITQVNQRSASLSKDLMKVLKMIDGKSNFGQIMERAELDKNQLEKALNTLTKDGFARVFQTKKEELDPFADEGDDFDFTAPGKMPVATQRVVPGAANDISELVRQQAKSDADRKSKEAAHTAAAAKAKAEAQVRAKLEAEAKAHQEAERQAMAQAQRAKEAAERARAEVEAQKREEEARQKAIAEQQVKLTAEQKAREEAESRRLAELRVKAEREAKALAEARARAEAEAAAMAKARAEADAAAKKQAAEASNAQAEMKARLKEEIEARIRGEMEELLRTEVAGQTRESMKAEIMAEAKLAAQAELEERLREERDSIAKAEAEARIKAERDASARADAESRKRAEAEARAKAETEARIRAEEETKRLRAQMEQDSRRAAEAAEARARESAESEKRLEAERQAKYEAEARAKIEAEEREKRERELSATIETERKGKQEAEARARIEAKARETIAEDTRAKVQAELESDLEKKAEIEGKAQAKAYMHAKVQAEQEEDQKIRDEQAKRAREIADVLRTRVEAGEKEEAVAAPRRRAARRGNLVKPAIFGALALVVLAIGLLHVVPLRPYAAKIERTLGEWLQDDVSIETMTFRLVPSPHLRVENVAVGKSLDAKAATGRIDVDIFSLFGSRPSINSIELDNVQLTAEAVQRIPRWGRTEGKGEAGGIARIALRGVKLEVKPPLEPFNATLNFNRDGALRQAVLNAPSGWAVTLKPVEKGFEFDATARNLNLPMGPTFPVSDSRFKGTLIGKEIVVPEFEIDTMGGKANGALKISWGQNVRLESDLALAKVNAGELVAAFTKAIAITGKMDGNFSLVTEGPSLEALFTSPRAQGKFKLDAGTISNVDLVAVMQSESAGTRAGVTKFNELSGEITAADHRSLFKQMSLEGGVLRGNGNVEVGSNGSLSGRLAIEIRSKVASDRGTFSVSGTVSRPILKRGG